MHFKIDINGHTFIVHEASQFIELVGKAGLPGPIAPDIKKLNIHI